VKPDLDAFEERAAIMEFDGGMSRFNAETMAAKRQGFQRREVMDAIGKRNSAPARDQREAVERERHDNLPGVQPAPKKEA
jgi:hypothetical protein